MIKKILVILHPSLNPSDQIIKSIDRDKYSWMCEYDVINTLKLLGHKVFIQEVEFKLASIKNAIEKFKPDVVFNLLEQLNNEAVMDSNIVAYLETLNIPYTGCSSRALMIARDKALSKKIFSYHGVLTPKFEIYPLKSKRKIKSTLKFPQIVKCLNEEASLGISKSSIVYNNAELTKRVGFIHRKFQTHALVEEFIEGKEYFVGILGTDKIKTFPVWELVYKNIKNPEKEIYSENAKFNESYRQRLGIDSKKAKISDHLEKKIKSIAREVYKILKLDSYARIDFRVTRDSKIYVLEANSNPNLAIDDEFALSAIAQGISYSELIQKLINQAISKSSSLAARL